MNKVFKTGEQAANEVLNPFNDNPKDMPKYWSNRRVVNLSPRQYIGFVSEGYGATPDQLEKHRREHTDQNSIDELKNLMQKGTKLDMPWLILNDSEGHVPYFQEGLHRMIAAGDLYGHDTKFPVMLGYEDREDYEGIENWNLDQFKDYRKGVASRWKKRILDRELKSNQKDKERAANWFMLPIEAIDDDLVIKYYKELDDLFKEI